MKDKNSSVRPLSGRKVSKHVAAVYTILRISVVGVLVRQLFMGNYMNVALCVLTLILFYIPDIADRTFNIKLPDALEVIILLFIYAAEILGEIREYYIALPYWDTMLHTINGFLMAAIGFAMVNVLNKSEKIHLNLSPVFLAVVAFCFSMTIGVAWEFFEYASDCFMSTDMQKDTWVYEVSTVTVHPEGKNVAVNLTPSQIQFNDDKGIVYAYEQKYLDIGLHDTMKDLLVNCIGAVVFSAIGALYVSGKVKGKLVKAFVPVLKSKEEIIKDKEQRENKKSNQCDEGQGQESEQQ